MAKNGKDRDDGDEAEENAAPAAKPSRKKLVLIIAGVVALLGVSIGGTALTMSLLAKPEPARKVAKKAPAASEDAETKDGEEKEGGAKAEGEEKAEAEDDLNPDGTPKTAIYMDFDQPFVVNFFDEGQLRYLQVTVSVMAKDQKVIDEVRRHMPLIRNNLVMLLSGQTRETILPRDGKEKIRKEAEAEVQRILTTQTGSPGIKSLYLTSFVMQ